MTTLAQPMRRPATYTGVWSWITTVDHKRIGILYGVTALFFFMVGGIEALLIRSQLAVPGNTVVTSDTYSQLFTMHGTTMIFLAVMPLSAAFFNFMVPLMIGARDVAFPRLNALSYWVFLFGGLFLNSSFLLGGAPDAGWFGYANLTSNQFSPGARIDFWVLGLQVLGLSSLIAALNFIVTILNLRAPGMSMMRMPLFVWMTLITSFLLVFALPVLTVGLTLLLFDRFFGTHFYLPAGGGDPVLWQHLFWIFGHPEVYILILPAMGMVSEVLPTFSRKPLFGYPFVVYSGILIAFLGFGVWAHHMFAVGMGPVADAFFATTTMLIAVPTGVKIFNWIGTLWGGALDFKSPLYFALGFIGMFIIGGLSGVMHASVPLDLQQTDTYFVVAHLHYVLFGGAIFGLFAGVYYWFPKITGRMLNDTWGKVHFWLMFVGANLTFFPMHFLGLEGMPRRIYTYDPGMGWDLWNLVATIGSFTVALSVLVFFINAITSLRRGARAPNDPWDGQTLEWTISSPPPVYNFAAIPTVHSVRPFWDQKYPDAAHGKATAPAKQAAHAEPERHGDIHMPNPSYFPIVIALGILVAVSGLMIHPAVTVLGAVVMLIGIYGWSFEPAG